MSGITEVQLMRFLAHLSRQVDAGSDPSQAQSAQHTDTSELYAAFSGESDLFEFLLKELEEPEDQRLKDVVRQIAEFLETQTSASLAGEEGRAVSDFVYPVV